MNYIKTDIKDVVIVEPKVFCDERGWFFESYSQASFNKYIGRDIKFVQDNHSASQRGVLRGLHYQKGEAAQAKLVRCISGAIFDVAVDIRRESSSFGCWIGEVLSSKNKRQLWIPEGFAHGFLALEDGSEVLYKTNNLYSPRDEGSIIWNDSDINIEWPDVGDIILSCKDMAALKLSEIK
ncbi:dTDP-4-dehydrorhamnose 3,5-epimerase [Plesiomonas shigelloides]|uniref:dTDP-4-dehydrorhamnose 3,5-epimerase n=1 Tax=Plesiomonas shigelloides TaxID=703 RepID=UPI003EBE4F78